MIVFDSSTIILLAKTELLDVLINSYKGDILITKGVERESTIKEIFDGLLIKKRIEEGKIKVKIIDDRNVESFMWDFKIGLGEAEALFLALKERSILATDDKNAINACKLLKIPFTTAIDVLIIAKGKKLISDEEIKIKLNQLAKFGRYKKEILEDAKRRLV